MTTRRRSKTPSAPPGWKVSETFVAPTGRHLTRGTEVSIRGERGRFRFLRHVVTASGAEWIDVVGGTRGVAMRRAFAPDRIRRVHRLDRLRPTATRRAK